MTELLFIIIAIGFVLLNAFFVAAEFSLVKLRQTRIPILQQQHGLRGKMLAAVHRHLDAYLSTCQLGITLASLGLGWVGEPAFAHLLKPLLSWLGIHSVEIIEFVAFIVAFAVISFLHIVVGELMPKSLAIRQAEKMSLLTATPLYGFYWLMYPAIWLLNRSATGLLKLFNLHATHSNEHGYSAEEITLMLKASHWHGTTEQNRQTMLLRMLEFAELKAIDIMRPAEEMVSLNTTASLNDIMDIIAHYRYSRYPVYENKPQNFIGILHTKNLLIALQSEPQLTAITSLVRPALKVSRETSASQIFEEFRQGASHFALVYNQDRLLGFITLDSMLSVLLGKLQDEFNFTVEPWKQLANGHYLVKGIASLYTIEQLLNLDLSRYPVDTITGFIMHEFKYMPEIDEVLDCQQFTLVPKNIQNGKIIELELIPHTIVIEQNKRS